MKLNGTRRLVTDALLTAVALTIFVIELSIPSLMPVPGVKPGLANIITLTAFFIIGPADAAAILFCRVILGCMFSGNMMSLIYSAAGGLACYTVTLLLYRHMSVKQIFILGILGSVTHVTAQTAAAIIVTNTPLIISYLPVLVLSAIISGLFTGYASQCAVNGFIKHFGIPDSKKRRISI